MIRGHITADDLVTAQRLHGAGARKRSYAVAAISVSYGLFQVLGNDTTVAPYFVWGGIGLASAVWASAQWLLPIKMRRVLKQRHDLRDEFSYQWDGECISGTSLTGNSKRPWKTYLKILESDKVVLLYQSDNLFEMLPKRWFSKEQLEEFRNAASVVGRT